MAAAALGSDIPIKATVAAVIAGVLTRAAAKHWLRAKPSGPKLYFVQRKDSTTPWLKRLLFGDSILLMPLQAGEAHWRFTMAARRALNDPGAHAAFVVGLTPRVIVSNPLDARFALIDNADNVQKPVFMRALEPLLGRHGLVTILSEAYHTKQFRNVSHAFSPANIRGIAATTMREKFARTVDALREHLQRNAKEGERRVVHTLMTESALAIISEAAFRTDDFTNVRHFVDALQNRPSILTILFGPSVAAKVPFSGVAGVIRTREAIGDLVHSVVAKARATKASSAGEEDDGTSGGTTRQLIDLLADNPALSVEEIRDHATTFVFAGHETTANALNWLCYLLSKHRDVQEALFEELQCTFAAGAVPPVETLLQLPLLNAVVLEALRYYPPVVVVGREVTRDEILPGTGTFVPAGTSLIVPIHTLHRDPEVWGADADKFLPSRWIDDPELKGRVQGGSFLPFAAGKRACIGKDFAMQEMLIGAALFFRNFAMAWPEGQPEPFREVNVVQRPRVPFELVVTLRDE